MDNIPAGAWPRFLRYDLLRFRRLQYQDDDFATLSGARIVRIATNPDFSKMGYGSRALSILTDFFSGNLMNVDERKKVDSSLSYKNASRVDEVTRMHRMFSARLLKLHLRAQHSRKTHRYKSATQPRCRLCCNV